MHVMACNNTLGVSLMSLSVTRLEAWHWTAGGRRPGPTGAALSRWHCQWPRPPGRLPSQLTGRLLPLAPLCRDWQSRSWWAWSLLSGQGRTPRPSPGWDRQVLWEGPLQVCWHERYGAQPASQGHCLVQAVSSHPWRHSGPDRAEDSDPKMPGPHSVAGWRWRWGGGVARGRGGRRGSPRGVRVFIGWLGGRRRGPAMKPDLHCTAFPGALWLGYSMVYIRYRMIYATFHIRGAI